jgi:uncharacterized protein (DUF983 family)
MENREVELVKISEIKKVVGENCVVCDEEKLTGIHLYTSFICVQCEQEMIGTDTDDPRYKYYLRQLRKVQSPEICS